MGRYGAMDSADDHDEVQLQQLRTVPSGQRLFGVVPVAACDEIRIIGHRNLPSTCVGYG